MPPQHVKYTCKNGQCVIITFLRSFIMIRIIVYYLAPLSEDILTLLYRYSIVNKSIDLFNNEEWNAHIDRNLLPFMSHWICIYILDKVGYDFHLDFVFRTGKMK